jgi:hypothetical protein
MINRLDKYQCLGVERMRLIDAEALDAAFTALRFNSDGSLKHWGDRPDWCLHGNEIETLLKDAPTIEPKRGRWILQKDPYEFFDAIPVCSNCGTTTKYREKYPYCPWCGAAMTEGGETDD